MSPSEEKMYDLIDRLNQLWETGFHILPPLIVVKSQELSRIISSFPDAISNEIRDAHVILRKKDDIIQDAKMKAERIITEAENERHRFLNESSLNKAVEERAREIREQVIKECEAIKMKAFNEAESTRLAAQEEAIKIKEGAQRLAQEILNKLDGDLKQLYQVVATNQQYLADMQYQNSQLSSNYEKRN